MASKDRERRLARERYERQQARRAERRARQRRVNQIVAAVVSVALVLGAVILLAVLNSGGDDETATATPTPSASASSTPSASPTGPNPCTAAAPKANPSPAQFKAPADQKLDPAKTYTATLSTNCGDIVVQLDAGKAPKTVNSFVFLARQGFFNGAPCGRVTDDSIFVLQCGDPTGTNAGGPGYAIPLENDPKDGSYPAGTLAMARGSETDSGGSQFFIVYDDTQLGTPGYTVFGHVTKGLDIVKQVAALGNDGSNSAGGGVPNQGIGFTKVTITETKAGS